MQQFNEDIHLKNFVNKIRSCSILNGENHEEISKVNTNKNKELRTRAS